jgi:preprotein translocase subunit SecA
MPPSPAQPPATSPHSTHTPASRSLVQAIEAKEGLDVQGEDFVQASITFQMLFTYYEKLAGMTVSTACTAWKGAGLATFSVGL